MSILFYPEDGGHIMDRKKSAAFLKGFVVVFLVIVLTLAYFLIRRIGSETAPSEPSQTEAPSTDAFGSVVHTTQPPVLSGSCDLLFGCGEGDRVDFLIRTVVDLDEKTVRVFAIPTDLTLSYAGAQASVHTVFAEGGASALASALGGYYSDSFDRYYFCSPNDFADVTKLLGNAEIHVKKEVTYVREDVSLHLQAGKHSLSGEELYDYLVYADTGDALLSAQSEAFAAMLRAYCVPATVGEGETLFSRIINKAQSNITAFDFAEVQPLLEQMAQNTDMQYLSCGIAPLAGGEDA